MHKINALYDVHWILYCKVQLAYIYIYNIFIGAMASAGIIKNIQQRYIDIDI